MSSLSVKNLSSPVGGGKSYKDFFYSVTIKATDPSAKAFRVEFGKDEEQSYVATFDFEQGLVRIGSQEMDEIKSEDYAFEADTDYKIDLILNDGVAKIYINEYDTPTLLLSLDGYRGGSVSTDLDVSPFEHGHESITRLDTLSGDYFVGGYTVSKVVNLTDGNYRLSADQYKVEAGVITINREYLNTLEVATLYKFRAVTSLTDFDFFVETDEVGTQARAQIDQYYRGSDVSFELSEASLVSKVLIDNEEFAFTQNEEKTLVTVASASLSSLPAGDHNVKFYTANGRPEAKLSLYSTVEVIPELPVPTNHMYFFIDIAIFGVLIIGYVLFSQISKRGKKN
ncbi:MAG: hypothetical protein E7179_05075 [Erysipelotrichaceae bacterium]|jgi:hypothetical protein|nr:hypothetical protein [Erysipelotrichaceae bacterium]